MPGCRTIWIIGFCSGPISGHPGNAAAQTPPADVQQRVEALEARIRELEQQLASARGVPAARQHRVCPADRRQPCARAGHGGGDEQLAGRAAADARSARNPRSSSSISRYASSAVNSSSTGSRPPSARKPLQRSAPAARGLRCAPPMAPSSCGCAGTCNPTGASTRTTMAEQGADTFVLRRVRPILEGTLFKNFDVRLTPDFGGGTTVLQDAYVDLRFTSGREDPCGEVQDAVRPRTPGVGNRPPVRRACAANGASRRTATSACCSTATSSTRG